MYTPNPLTIGFWKLTLYAAQIQYLPCKLLFCTHSQKLGSLLCLVCRLVNARILALLLELVAALFWDFRKINFGNQSQILQNVWFAEPGFGLFFGCRIRLLIISPGSDVCIHALHHQFQQDGSDESGINCALIKYEFLKNRGCEVHLLISSWILVSTQRRQCWKSHHCIDNQLQFIK